MQMLSVPDSRNERLDMSMAPRITRVLSQIYWGTYYPLNK